MEQGFGMKTPTGGVGSPPTLREVCWGCRHSWGPGGLESFGCCDTCPEVWAPVLSLQETELDLDLGPLSVLGPLPSQGEKTVTLGRNRGEGDSSHPRLRESRLERKGIYV